MKSKILKDALVLTLITVIAGCLLGIVYKVTEQPIKNAEYNTQQNAYRSVFSDADSFEDNTDYTADSAAEALASTDYGSQNTIDGVVNALDSSGNLLGYVITVTDSQGYGGDVTFSVGIQSDGTVNGIAFTSISETAGLGMKAKDDAFKSQYENKKVDSFEVTKTGATDDSQINAISGATITSKAVTSGVNAALSYFQTSLGGGTNE